MYRHYDGELNWHEFKKSEEYEKGSFFLVCFDERRIKDVEESRIRLRKMLDDNGFRCAKQGGLVSCPWLFIDVTTKIYVVGKAGLKIADPVGGHAITPDEFITIYEIYRKYEDKEVLVF